MVRDSHSGFDRNVARKRAMNAGRLNETLRKAFRAEEDGNLRVAIRLFKAASRLGSTAARSKLGTIFDDVLAKPDPIKAVYWYRRGVAGGDSGCAWNLAMHYAGLGRRRNYLYWLRVARKLGDPDARKELSTERWWKKRNSTRR
jgi:TPR repeat protein